MHLFGLLRSPKVILANPVTMNSRNVTPTSSTAISIFTPVKCSYLGSHRLLSELIITAGFSMFILVSWDLGGTQNETSVVFVCSFFAICRQSTDSKEIPQLRTEMGLVGTNCWWSKGNDYLRYLESFKFPSNALIMTCSPMKYWMRKGHFNSPLLCILWCNNPPSSSLLDRVVLSLMGLQPTQQTKYQLGTVWVDLCNEIVDQSCL